MAAHAHINIGGELPYITVSVGCVRWKIKWWATVTDQLGASLRRM